MKLTILLLCLFSLSTIANTFSQQITLSVKNEKLLNVIKEVRKQSQGYDFAFNTKVLDKATPVTVDLRSADILKALEIIFDGQPLQYEVKNRTIIIKEKPARTTDDKITTALTEHQDPIRGHVTDENGQPLSGATIKIKGERAEYKSDSEGYFEIPARYTNAILRIEYMGFVTNEILASQAANIMLNRSESVLDETVVIAYGTTTRRLNTGSVTRVTAEDIENQPVTNPLAVLAGRVPGMTVTQSSGMPGSSYRIQVRGINSIAQGSEPFFIIDGVPYAPNNENMEQVAGPYSFYLSNMRGGMSPFNSINPADIESIEILKDADATAIYGSRGANGVVLITTKKGNAGRTKIDANIQTGVSKVTRIMPMLNTQQYVNMRKKAFENDGVTMTNANAYDILVWDTTRYTNWVQELIGGTANRTNGQLSLSGGNENIQFLIAGNFNRETTVYPGDLAYKRGGLHFNINHTSSNNRFKALLTGTYSSDVNNIIPSDLAGSVVFLPNLPSPFDEEGKLKWTEGGYPYTNPYADLVRKHKVNTNNLISNLTLDYRLSEELSLKLNSGYNTIRVDELSTFPIEGQNPNNNPIGRSTFGNNALSSVIIEPQLNYQKNIYNSTINVLLGATWQTNQTDGRTITATGFTNDDLLESVGAATAYSATPNIKEYRYAALFGRINYNYGNTYLLNITARRDGSSRFGPGRKYANFGALGAAWVFSNLPLFDRAKLLSFGKLRSSYGITGNDAIGDYRYLDTYLNTQHPYDGVPGLYPNQLFNPDYGWEVNRKFELGLDVGLFNDKLYLTTSWYRNRSSNQLVNYILPIQTGFNGIVENLNAIVQNSGLELDINAEIVKSKGFNWSTAFNITVPKNRLVAFPGLETSSYRNRYTIGKSLNIGSGFRIADVDPETGVYRFYDRSGEVTANPSFPDDRIVGLINLDPKYFGGFQNNFNFRQWTLGVLLDFRKQMGYSSSHNFNSLVGNQVNQAAIFGDVWEKSGDFAQNQRYSIASSSPAYRAWLNIVSYGADRQYTDASFIRVKNISLSYDLSNSILEKMKLNNMRLYVEGHNLFLMTKYYGADPETQLPGRTPPLKTIVMGLQLSL